MKHPRMTPPTEPYQCPPDADEFTQQAYIDAEKLRAKWYPNNDAITTRQISFDDDKRGESTQISKFDGRKPPKNRAMVARG